MMELFKIGHENRPGPVTSNTPYYSFKVFLPLSFTPRRRGITLMIECSYGMQNGQRIVGRGSKRNHCQLPYTPAPSLGSFKWQTSDGETAGKRPKS